MNELAVDKTRYSVHIDLQSAEKLMENCAKKGETLPELSMRLLLEEAGKYKISAKGLQKVREQIKARTEERMAKRMAKRSGKNINLKKS